MSDLVKVKRETKRIADQANNFYFEPVHVLCAAIIVGFAIYGVVTLLHKFGVI